MEDLIYLLEEARNTLDKQIRASKLRQAKVMFDALMIVEGITNPSAGKNILHG